MDQDLDFCDIVDKVLDSEKLNRTEGQVGVENLAKFAGLLGYTDSQYFGQFKGGSLGVLINFLEDNPAAVETIYDWVREQCVPEWEERLREKLPEEDEEE